MQDLFNGRRFGPPPPIKRDSPCPGIDHLASGLMIGTNRPFRLAFATNTYQAFDLILILAPIILLRNSQHLPINSPDHSSIGTLSAFLTCVSISLELLVCIQFQVLFHSASAVLFAFPSRYWFTIGLRLVFSLGGWSPQIPTRFHVPDGTQDTTSSQKNFIYRTITFFGRFFQTVQLFF